LLVQAKQASQTLHKALKKAGAKVTVVEAYRSAVPSIGERGLAPLHGTIEGQNIDLITFASSLTAENFFKMAGSTRIPVACIGPVTAKAARSLGFDVAVVPKKSTMPHLVRAIEDFFSKTKD